MSINNENAVAPKGGNSVLAGALIPSYSSVALGLSYAGPLATNLPNFSNSYGSTEWRNGIDIGATANGSNNANIFYAIYSDQVSQGYSPSTNVSVGWGITGSTETDILNTINGLPGMTSVTKHTTYTDAISWLIAQNKYLPVNRDYPAISYSTTTPLVVAYDPSFMASYPFVGNSFYDLTGYSTNFASLNGSSIAWDNVNKNSFRLDSDYFDYIQLDPSVIDGLNSNSMTISVWFKAEDLVSIGTEISTIFQLCASGSASNPTPGQYADNIWSRIYLNSTGAIFYDGDPQQTGGGIGGVQIGSIALGAPVWHNLVVLIDGSTGTSNIGASLDGGALTRVSYSFVTTGPFDNTGGILGYIGASYDGFPSSGTFFKGWIGSMHIYKNLLTEDQARDIYTKTVSIFP
jgi:hypothetical protein